MFENHSQRRIGIGFAGVMLALTVAVAVLATGGMGAQVTSSNVTADDPVNESISVSVDFAAATDATVNISNSTSVVDSTTLTGTAGQTLSTTLDPANASPGESLTLTVDSPDAANVTVNSTSLTKTVGAYNVTNATETPLLVDVGFNSSTNTTATLTVTNSTGATVLTDTISYDATAYADNTAILSRSYNASDGLVAGNLSATITVNDPAAYSEAYVDVAAQSTTTGGGLLSGDIAGQDPVVAIVGVLVLGGAAQYARKEDMI